MIEKTITPQLAAELLAKQHRNRRINDRCIVKYLGEMEAGRWVADELCPIVVDAGGRLLDGQHRLAAVIRFGKPVSFMVAEGSLESVDRHSEARLRTNADRLQIMDGYTNATIVVALVRTIRHRFDWGPLPIRSLAINLLSTAEIRDWIEYLRKEYNVDIAKIVADAIEIYRLQPQRLRLLTPTTMGYLLFDASWTPDLYAAMQEHMRCIVEDDAPRSVSQRAARSRLMGNAEKARNIGMFAVAKSFNDRRVTKIQLPRELEPTVPDIIGGTMENLNAGD